jgi:hypothetical protein
MSGVWARKLERGLVSLTHRCQGLEFIENLLDKDNSVIMDVGRGSGVEQEGDIVRNR